MWLTICKISRRIFWLVPFSTLRLLNFTSGIFSRSQLNSISMKCINEFHQFSPSEMLKCKVCLDCGSLHAAPRHFGRGCWNSASKILALPKGGALTHAKIFCGFVIVNRGQTSGPRLAKAAVQSLTICRCSKDDKLLKKFHF